jgi:hypothetical protein
LNKSQWLKSKNPSKMLESLRGKGNGRKLRLFACACCNNLKDSILSESAKNAIEVIERFADSKASVEELAGARQVAEDASNEVEDDSSYAVVIAAAEEPWETTAVIREVEMEAAYSVEAALEAMPELKSEFGTRVQRETKARGITANLVRDIFGNPFQPVTFDPRWLSSTVIDLARTIYDERVFERMPILADALMDAGCDSEEILAHCHGTGPHVRGCWVVDLILAKE